uniref:Uncharacterized protein n=1 Tax=Zea mays TaxID=4577 RepID=C4IZQ1_MAIZE|nr:unknown [Zea mays]
MIPQATRPPAFPVLLLSSCPPLPRSSGSAWTTTARPMIEWGPARGIWLSVILTLTTPSSPAVTFPRSPAWRSSSSGAPCSLPTGLKCGPVDMQPLVVSPSACTWNPWSPGLRPEILPVTVVGPSPSCEKKMVPLTSVPARTATAFTIVSVISGDPPCAR